MGRTVKLFTTRAERGEVVLVIHGAASAFLRHARPKNNESSLLDGISRSTPGWDHGDDTFANSAFSGAANPPFSSSFSVTPGTSTWACDQLSLSQFPHTAGMRLCQRPRKRGNRKLRPLAAMHPDAPLCFTSCHGRVGEQAVSKQRAEPASARSLPCFRALRRSSE